MLPSNATALRVLGYAMAFWESQGIVPGAIPTADEVAPELDGQQRTALMNEGRGLTDEAAYALALADGGD